jgi:hypothetical protein
MPWGFKNSSAVFQRLMDGILREYIGKWCFVYIDDFFFSKTKEEHIHSLTNIIRKLISSGLKGNPVKCEFLRGNVKFLGYFISKNQIRPVEKKVDGI